MRLFGRGIGLRLSLSPFISPEWMEVF